MSFHPSVCFPSSALHEICSPRMCPSNNTIDLGFFWGHILKLGKRNRRVEIYLQSVRRIAATRTRVHRHMQFASPQPVKRVPACLSLDIGYSCLPARRILWRRTFVGHTSFITLNQMQRVSLCSSELYEFLHSLCQTVDGISWLFVAALTD